MGGRAPGRLRAGWRRADLPVAALAAAHRRGDRSRRQGRSRRHRVRGPSAHRCRARAPSAGRGVHRAQHAMTDDVDRRVAEVLDGLGVPYEVMQIDPDFADTAAFCERYSIPLDNSANTIIVASKKEPKQYCACVVKATTRLDVNHTVKRLMGVSRVSFASADETQALTGMMIGGVTVFALPADLPIYVDEAVTKPDWIILGGGSRSTKVKAAPEVLRRLTNATIVPGLAT